MHAYLLISQNSKVKSPASPAGRQIDELSKRLKAKVLEFPLQRIEDTRELNSFVNLKVSETTAILINSIDEATAEAANAFLKNLEEPQENLYYILTARSIHSVLPTIVSRCQVIKVHSSKFIVHSENADKFLRMSIGEKLAYVDKVKGREEAREFVEELIETSHASLQSKKADYTKLAANLKVETATLSALKANGNVALQLANMAINLAK